MTIKLTHLYKDEGKAWNAQVEIYKNVDWFKSEVWEENDENGNPCYEEWLCIYFKKDEAEPHKQNFHYVEYSHDYDRCYDVLEEVYEEDEQC